MSIYQQKIVLRVIVQRTSGCGQNAFQKTLLREIKIPTTHWEKLLVKHIVKSLCVQDIQRNLVTQREKKPIKK